jgi:tripartite ATP-independent transporter DctM subunit
LITITFALLIGLLGLGMPVAFAIMASSFAYFFFVADVPAGIFIQRLVSGLDSFPLLAVPFFVLTGTAMSRGGIAARIFGLADALVGHMKGGLGQINVVQSLFIGGMCGSANADAAIDSKTIVPVMVRHGYGRGFASAVTATSAVIAPIIPPGIGLVIFGLVANVSIGRLFIGGIVPGLLMSLALMIVVTYIARRRDYGGMRTERLPFREVLHYARESFWALMMPLLLIVGLRMGVFTPTELGAVAALYALLVGIVIYREIKLKEIMSVLVEATLSSAVVMLILGAASGLSYVITWECIPQIIVETLTALSNNPYTILLIINSSLLVMGTMIESTSLLIILTPILMPLLRNLGVEPVQFGVVMVVNLTIGAVTPPVGTILYTVCSITGSPVGEFTREVIPFVAALLFVLLLITYIPWLVLFLPNLIMG